jgi:DNA topoisomerase-1
MFLRQDCARETRRGSGRCPRVSRRTPASPNKVARGPIKLRNGGAPRAAAKAGLCHVSDDGPGISRIRRGTGFAYRDAAGRAIADTRQLARIRRLAIPPAYVDVWISPGPRGHLQATGRDARGRKQYRYHPLWREHRDRAKYERLADFARALPAIRARVERDLGRRGLGRAKVLASAVRLLEMTLMRVGNEQYKRENNSFGLTTLRDRHVSVNGRHVAFEFRGKGGKLWVVRFSDPRLARVIKHCQDLPGQELFQYVSHTGRRRKVTSDDVNAYIRRAAEAEFSAKDFRTWAGTLLACEALQRHLGHPDKHAKRCLKSAVEAVSARLGNTVSICRKCYIHPAVVDAFLDRSLRRGRRERRLRGLSSSEAAVLALVERDRRLRG